MLANDDYMSSEYSCHTPHDSYTKDKLSHLSDDEDIDLIGKKDTSRFRKFIIGANKRGFPYAMDYADFVKRAILREEPRLLLFEHKLSIESNPHGGYFMKYGNSLYFVDNFFNDRFLEFDDDTYEIRYMDYEISTEQLMDKFYITLREISSAKISIRDAEKLFTSTHNPLETLKNLNLGYLTFYFNDDYLANQPRYCDSEHDIPIPTSQDKIKCYMIIMNKYSDIITLFDPLIIYTDIAPPLYHGMKVCYVYNKCVINNLRDGVPSDQWPISLGGTLPENGDDYTIILFKLKIPAPYSRVHEYRFVDINIDEEIDYDSLVNMMRFMRHSTKSARQYC